MALPLIQRLPAWQQTYFLAKLSRNANAPGAGARQTNGRAQRHFCKRAAELGIFVVESNVTGALAADVGGVNPPNNVLVTLTTGVGGTPATTDIIASEKDAVTWAGSGAKAITVSVPTDLNGAGVVVV